MRILVRGYLLDVVWCDLCARYFQYGSATPIGQDLFKISPVPPTPPTLDKYALRIGEFYMCVANVAPDWHLWHWVEKYESRPYVATMYLG